jgi:anti-anti-sigma factor
MPTVSRQNEVSVLVLDPEEKTLDSATAAEMDVLIFQLAGQAEPPAIVVDMRNVVFLGSAFLEVLLAAWKRLKGRGGRLAICELTPLCAEVFRVTKLDTLWEMFPHREAAVSALSPGVPTA